MTTQLILARFKQRNRNCCWNIWLPFQAPQLRTPETTIPEEGLLAILQYFAVVYESTKHLPTMLACRPC